MNLEDTEDHKRYRAEVRAFLTAEWPAKGQEGQSKGDALKRFMKKATDAGYVNRNIPKRYGGSEQEPDIVKGQIIREEFSRAKAPSGPSGNNRLVIPPLLKFGSEELKNKFIPPTLTGEFQWAQGYSEPGAGSDLASLRTKGVVDGDEWVINGQKIWTTLAQYCNVMFILVRTEPDAPKHQGISYILMDMKQPGIEVRPLRQINGASEFNEVFLTDARAPLAWTVGPRGKGWEVSRATLSEERNVVGSAADSLQLFDRLMKLVHNTERNGRPSIKDPEVRQWLTELEGFIIAQQYSSLRQFSLAAKGKEAGLYPLTNKIYGTDTIGMRVMRIAQELLGDDGLTLVNRARLGHPGSGETQALGNERWTNYVIASLAALLGGGTSNMHRNMVAERGLGLPRDQ